MGEAKQRGTYEQRKREAISAGRVKVVRVSKPLPSAGELFAMLLALSAVKKRKVDAKNAGQAVAAGVDTDRERRGETPVAEPTQEGQARLSSAAGRDDAQHESA